MSLLLIGSLTACAVDPESPEAPVETGIATQHEVIVPDDCDPLICPGNSDILAALGPFELSTNPAQMSSRGFRLDSVRTAAGTQLDTFHVAGATLSGSYTDPDGDQVLLTQPAQFVGARLRVAHSSGVAFDLVIEAYLHVPFFDLTKPARIHGFKISYLALGGGREPRRRDLCKHTGVVPPGEDGPAQTWAIFWKGERYNPDTGEITASGLGLESLGHVGSWFNISCDNEAWIKVLRDEASKSVAPGFATRRTQATLSMFTAKYCPGDATRYTELGKPLAWDDAWSSSTLGAIASVEAIWDRDGAVCLTRPRMYKLTDIACEPPPCSPEMVASWSTHGALISGNPTKPPLFLAPP